MGLRSKLKKSAGGGELSGGKTVATGSGTTVAQKQYSKD